MGLVALQTVSAAWEAWPGGAREVAGSNVGGWAALGPLEPVALSEGLRQSGLPVLKGARGAVALGSIEQIWAAARSLADGLEREQARALAAELRKRAANVESGPARWELPRTPLPKGRTLIMGVGNVTPDSFSDAGKFLDPARAVEHGLLLAEQGADILDIGGESTNPFLSRPIDAKEERARVEPVIRELAKRAKLPISIDTSKSEVASAALDAGAEIVNDVSGMARDAQMARAAKGAAVCLMAMRRTPPDMQTRTVYHALLCQVHRQ